MTANVPRPSADHSREFFSEEETRQLIRAIQAAELRTSGEIRIHIESTCDDPVERARQVFAELGMDHTEERNGVLFYLATESRLFAVLGDVGLDERVDAGFWQGIRDAALDSFRKGEFLAGLIDGVRTAGESLAKHFPRRSDDANELPDEISFGK